MGLGARETAASRSRRTNGAKRRAALRALAVPLLLTPLLTLTAPGAEAVEDDPTWTQKSPSTSPPARDFHAMAYDAARGEVVLFGGDDASDNRLNDTWVWDGSDWTQKSPSTSPPARSSHAMAFDAARGEVVLFGGFDGFLPRRGDTWVWNGTDWTQRSPSTSPPARSSHAMAFDAAEGEVVLFGGHGDSSVGDTWVWDGTNWTQRSPSSRPSARWDHAMAFDAARGEVVLFGGSLDGFGTVAMGDTWVWGPDSTLPPVTTTSIPLPTTTTTTLLPGENPVGELLGEGLGYPSDDCDAGTVLVDGFAGDHYVKVRAQAEPGGSDQWVCTRVDGPGLRTGGKLVVDGDGPAGPSFEEGEAEAAACATEIDSGELGDPDDPDQVPPHTPYRLAFDVAEDEVSLCVKVDDESDGGIVGRVVVPVSVGGAQFFPDDPDEHVPLRDPIDPARPSATCGSDGEVANAESAGTHTWVATAESGTETFVCVRHEGATSTGGLLTVDSAGSTGVETSTTDMSPCGFNVFSNSVVSITRSSLAVPVSVCVGVLGDDLVRVTVTDPSADPIVDWEFD